MLKGAVMTHNHVGVKEDYAGTWVAVPTLATASDICVTALRRVVDIYHAAYGGQATTVLYPLTDAEFVKQMRTEPYTLPGGLQFWVELPSTIDAWGVLGRDGIVWVEGA